MLEEDLRKYKTSWAFVRSRLCGCILPVFSAPEAVCDRERQVLLL